jgi:hypothetical protein
LVNRNAACRPDYLGWTSETFLPVEANLIGWIWIRKKKMRGSVIKDYQRTNQEFDKIKKQVRRI